MLHSGDKLRYERTSYIPKRISLKGDLYTSHLTQVLIKCSFSVLVELPKFNFSITPLYTNILGEPDRHSAFVIFTSSYINNFLLIFNFFSYITCMTLSLWAMGRRFMLT